MSHQLLQEEEITPRSALPYRPIHGKTSSDHGVGVPRASRQPRLSDTKPSTKTSLRSGSPRRAEYHKLFFVDIGMLLALAVVVLGHIALNWISVTEDDLHYGRPRTYQVDALIRAMTIIPIWWWCLGGCVAKKVGGGEVKAHLLFSLGRHSKQAGDEGDLLLDISLSHLSHLSLPDHVHDLISLQRSPGRFHRKEAIPGLTKRLIKR